MVTADNQAPMDNQNAKLEDLKSDYEANDILYRLSLMEGDIGSATYFRDKLLKNIEEIGDVAGLLYGRANRGVKWLVKTLTADVLGEEGASEETPEEYDDWHDPPGSEYEDPEDAEYERGE